MTNVNVSLFTTSKADFSSDAVFGVCSGTAATDIIATTSVGLGNLATGMVVTFYQVTGGTVMAGITSGNEYVISAVTTASSSFQVYAQGGSSAVNITADSTGSDRWIRVIGGNIIGCKEFRKAIASVTTTTGYDGEFRFVGNGTTLNMDSSGRISTSNPMEFLAYHDMQNATATNLTIAGDTTVDSSGIDTRLFKLDLEGVNEVSMRTRNFVGGGINATINLFD